MGRGGKREGSGRPPNPNKKVLIAIRLDADLAEWLKQQCNQSRVIEKALRDYIATNTTHTEGQNEEDP